MLQLLVTGVVLGGIFWAPVQSRHLMQMGGDPTIPPTHQTIESLEVTLPFEFSLPGMPITQLLNASFAITLPAQNDSGAHGPVPLLFLMHGFNVPPEFYSRLTGDLARKGYAVVAPDVLQAANGQIPGLPRPGCPSVYHQAYASLLNVFYDNLEDFPVSFEEWNVNASSLVLFAHSLGGIGAIAAVAGKCSGQPTAMTASACGEYRPLNASIRGIVAYEGAGPGLVEVPRETFMLYLDGSFTNISMSASQSTYGSSCTGALQFVDMSHFGITDYIEGGAGQVTPCARPASWDPPNWTTTEQLKNTGIGLIADVVDAAIMGSLSGDWDTLQDFLGSPRVRGGEFHGPCAA